MAKPDNVEEATTQSLLGTVSVPERVAQEGKVLEAKGFDKLPSGITPEENAQRALNLLPEKNSEVTLETITGNSFTGKIISKNDKTVVIELPSGQSLPIPTKNIVESQTISLPTRAEVAASKAADDFSEIGRIREKLVENRLSVTDDEYTLFGDLRRSRLTTEENAEYNAIMKKVVEGEHTPEDLKALERIEQSANERSLREVGEGVTPLEAPKVEEVVAAMKNGKSVEIDNYNYVYSSDNNNWRRTPKNKDWARSDADADLSTEDVLNYAEINIAPKKVAPVDVIPKEPSTPTPTVKKVATPEEIVALNAKRDEVVAAMKNGKSVEIGNYNYVYSSDNNNWRRTPKNNGWARLDVDADLSIEDVFENIKYNIAPDTDAVITLPKQADDVTIPRPDITPAQTATKPIPLTQASDVSNIESGRRGFVGIGDLHAGAKTDEGREAFYNSFYADLNSQKGNPFVKDNGNLLDIEKWDWIGGDGVLLQVGDIYDRGEDATKIRNAFNKWAVQAEDEGGKVVRLLGNHELGYLGSGGISLSELDANNLLIFRKEIMEDVENGRIVAAAVIDGKLCTHAGVNKKLLAKLSHDWESWSPQMIAQEINDRFKNAFRRMKEIEKEITSPISEPWELMRFNPAFDDPIFDSKIGVFWSRSLEVSGDGLPLKDFDLGFLQMRGHDVISHGNVESINILKNEKGENVLINLDIGRSEHYGGGTGVYTNKLPDEVLNQREAEILEQQKNLIDISQPAQMQPCNFAAAAISLPSAGYAAVIPCVKTVSLRDVSEGTRIRAEYEGRTISGRIDHVEDNVATLTDGQKIPLDQADNVITNNNFVRIVDENGNVHYGDYLSEGEDLIRVKYQNYDPDLVPKKRIKSIIKNEDQVVVTTSKSEIKGSYVFENEDAVFIRRNSDNSLRKVPKFSEKGENLNLQVKKFELNPTEEIKGFVKDMREAVKRKVLFDNYRRVELQIDKNTGEIVSVGSVYELPEIVQGKVQSIVVKYDVMSTSIVDISGEGKFVNKYKNSLVGDRLDELSKVPSVAVDEIKKTFQTVERKENNLMDFYHSYNKKTKTSIAREEGNFIPENWDNVNRLEGADNIYMFEDRTSGDLDWLYLETINKELPYGKRVRYYINSKDAQSSQEIFERVARKLDQNNIAFKIKRSPRKADFFTRTDNMVLYIADENRGLAESILSKINPNLLDEEVPMFTNKFSKGISWGEDPSNAIISEEVFESLSKKYADLRPHVRAQYIRKDIEHLQLRVNSFGEQRAKALDEIYKLTGGDINYPNFDKISREIFEKHNIDLDQPWLNLNSKLKSEITPLEVPKVKTAEEIKSSHLAEGFKDCPAVGGAIATGPLYGFAAIPCVRGSNQLAGLQPGQEVSVTLKENEETVNGILGGIGPTNPDKVTLSVATGKKGILGRILGAKREDILIPLEDIERTTSKGTPISFIENGKRKYGTFEKETEDFVEVRLGNDVKRIEKDKVNSKLLSGDHVLVDTRHGEPFEATYYAHSDDGSTVFFKDLTEVDAQGKPLFYKFSTEDEIVKIEKTTPLEATKVKPIAENIETVTEPSIRQWRDEIANPEKLKAIEKEAEETGSSIIGERSFTLTTDTGKNIEVTQRLTSRGEGYFELEMFDRDSGNQIATHSYYLTDEGRKIESPYTFVADEYQKKGINTQLFQDMSDLHPNAKEITASLADTNKETYKSLLEGIDPITGEKINPLTPTEAAKRTPAGTVRQKAGWEINPEESSLPTLDEMKEGKQIQITFRRAGSSAEEVSKVEKLKTVITKPAEGLESIVTNQLMEGTLEQTTTPIKVSTASADSLVSSSDDYWNEVILPIISETEKESTLGSFAELSDLERTVLEEYAKGIGHGTEGIVVALPDDISSNSVLKVFTNAGDTSNVVPEQVKILNNLAEKGHAPRVKSYGTNWYEAEKVDDDEVYDYFLERYNELIDKTAKNQDEATKIKESFIKDFSAASDQTKSRNTALAEEIRSRESGITGSNLIGEEREKALSKLQEYKASKRAEIEKEYLDKIDEVFAPFLNSEDGKEVKTALDELTAVLAEEGYEVTDLHWSNVLLTRDADGKLKAVIIDPGYVIRHDKEIAENYLKEVYEYKIRQLMRGSGNVIGEEEALMLIKQRKRDLNRLTSLETSKVESSITERVPAVVGEEAARVAEDIPIQLTRPKGMSFREVEPNVFELNGKKFYATVGEDGSTVWKTDTFFGIKTKADSEVSSQLDNLVDEFYAKYSSELESIPTSQGIAEVKPRDFYLDNQHFRYYNGWEYDTNLGWRKVEDEDLLTKLSASLPVEESNMKQITADVFELDGVEYVYTSDGWKTRGFMGLGRKEVTDSKVLEELDKVWLTPSEEAAAEVSE